MDREKLRGKLSQKKLSLGQGLSLGGIAFYFTGTFSNLFLENYRDRKYIEELSNTISNKRRDAINNAPNLESLGIEMLVPFYSVFNNRYQNVEDIK